MTSLPPEVREAALFPELDLPVPPEGYPYTLRQRDGYQFGFRRGTTFAHVFVHHLDGELADRVAEVRTLVVEAGFDRAAWIVNEASRPAGLAARLLELGLEEWEANADGWDRRIRHMALVTEPPAGPGDIVARRVETFDEYVAAGRIGQAAFAMSDQDRRAHEEALEELWRWQERLPELESYVALADGEIVGSAQMLVGGHAAFLMGGSVREESRGRGAYRALVRARWEAAVELGTPALTVGAGSMSAPILERLGFETVGWSDVLEDAW